MLFRSHHVLAGKTTQASIKKIVFKNGTLNIPRYILIDESGKILSADFTRPSNPSFTSEIVKSFPK